MHITWKSAWRYDILPCFQGRRGVGNSVLGYGSFGDDRSWGLLRPQLHCHRYGRCLLSTPTLHLISTPLPQELILAFFFKTFPFLLPPPPLQAKCMMNQVLMIWTLSLCRQWRWVGILLHGAPTNTISCWAWYLICYHLEDIPYQLIYWRWYHVP